MKEWGTDVGVIEEESAAETPGAEPSSAVPSTAPDSSTAVAEPGVKPAQPAAVPATPPDEFEEHAKTLSGKNKVAFDRLRGVLTEHQGKLEGAEKTLQAFTEKGIASPEDAQFIVDRAVKAETALSDYRQSYTTNPIEFAARLSQENSQAWQTIAQNVTRASILELAKLEDAAGEKDRADFLREAAGRFSGQPQAQRTDPARQSLAQERANFQKQQDDAWEAEINTAIVPEIDSRIDKLIEGVKFLNDEQTQEFRKGVWASVKDEIGKRRAFTDRIIERAFGKDRSPNMKSETVKAYGAEVERGGLLEKIVFQRLKVFGLQAANAEERRQDILKKATQRTEVVGAAGGGSNGAQGDRARIIKQIDDEFEARGDKGSDEHIQARMAWRTRL